MMFSSLRWKITAWFVGPAALVVMLVGLAVFLLESRALSQQIDSSIRASGDSVMAAMAGNLRVGDYPEPLHAAEEAIETVVTHEWLNATDVFLVLLDGNGEVVANPDHVDAEGLTGREPDRDALQAETEGWATLKLADTRLRVKTSPIFDGDADLVGYVLAGRSTESRDSALRDLAMAMAGGGLLSLVLLGVAGYLVAGRSIRPVQESYQRQRQFVADASHELRTPLAVIRTNAEVLMRRYGGDEALEDIEAEARYMSRLVEDLLVLADSDRRRLNIEPAPIDLTNAVRTAARAASTLAQDAGVDFRTEIASDLPVEVDPERCRETILILLDNALKYTPRGGEVVLLAGRNDRYAVVEVRDTGIGMSSADLERAADRFFAVSSTRTRPEGSRGLGLSIAYALTAAMNGSLEIDSEVGKGTSARLRFLLRQAREPLEGVARPGRRPRWPRGLISGRGGQANP